MTELKQFLLSNETLVIGVSGKIGSGKTTLCEMIMDQFNNHGSLHVYFRNFGDSLKEQISDHFGFPLEWCYDQEGKRKMIASVDMSVGEILQKWGTGLREAVHDSVWISSTDTWIRKKMSTLEKKKDFFAINHVILIGDVRFPNEFSYIKDVCNGIVVRLEGDPAGERKRSNRDLNHISETALDDKNQFPFDLVIDSDTCSIMKSFNMVGDLIDKRESCIAKTQGIKSFDFYCNRMFPLLKSIEEFRKERSFAPLTNTAHVTARLLYNRCFSDSDVPIDLFTSEQWSRMENYVEDFSKAVPHWNIPEWTKFQKTILNTVVNK